MLRARRCVLAVLSIVAAAEGCGATPGASQGGSSSNASSSGTGATSATPAGGSSTRGSSSAPSSTVGASSGPSPTTSSSATASTSGTTSTRHATASGSGSSTSSNGSASRTSSASSASTADSGPLCGGAALGSGPLTISTTHLDIGVHDPSMIWDGSHYYLFATGGTLGVRSSANILTWSNAGNVFSTVPAWISTAVGSTVTDLWAPDVSYFNGTFHVYYAGSTFGSKSSVIGLATTATLASPTWTDQGLVVQSRSSDNFNAIDPNVSFDASCSPWLAYGSFWSGIKLHKLDATTGKLATDDTTTYSIASRGGGAIEAASIVSHGGYYYLFVSFDACCKGVNSTYRTMAGRATAITGPYVDHSGTDMMKGGGDQLLASSGRYIGPGGGTAWRDGDHWIYVYHYYDGDDNGVSKLQIRPIVFGSDGWISLGDPLFP